MITFTIVSFAVLISILTFILAPLIASDDSRKPTVIVFVLMVVSSLIFVFVIPPFDEWSAKRYDNAVKNVKIAREKYTPGLACKNDMTHYCLVINAKKLEKAIEDSISTVRDYYIFNAK